MGENITLGDIVYWFFRLNGCFTIRNFVIHPERRGSQRTEVDLLAVRFPYREEIGMQDHEIFVKEKTQLFIVEVKSTDKFGDFNEATIRNLDEIIKRVGFVKRNEIREVVDTLRTRAFWEDGNKVKRIDLMYVIKKYPHDLVKVKDFLSYKNFLVVESDILPFIFRRFTEYYRQKRDHEQWDIVGKFLFELAIRNAEGDFCKMAIEKLNRSIKV